MDANFTPSTDKPTLDQLRTAWDHARMTLLGTARTIAEDALAGRRVDVYRDTYDDAKAAERKAAEAYFNFPRPDSTAN